MAIQFNPLQRQGPTKFPPDFQTAEQFIRECELLLRRPVSPQHLLAENASLLSSIFPHLYEGRFDDHLELLLPLIQALSQRGADFAQMVVLNPGVHGWDLACHQTAFLYYKNLAEMNHRNTHLAWTIFEIVGRNINFEDSLLVGYLEYASVLLRQARQNNAGWHVEDRVVRSVFQDFASGFYDNVMHAFPDLVHALLECHGDPNVIFPALNIAGKGKYQNPTCLHVTFLRWKAFKAEGKSVEAKHARRAFLHLLKDPRIDVRAKLTEIKLERAGGHFSPTDNMFQGDYIEEGTLAHYALAEGDLKICRMLLSLAHDLTRSTCSTISGRWLLDVAPLENGDIARYSPSTAQIFWDTETPTRAWWPKHSYVTKHEQVTLLHIAARRLDLVACTFLGTLGNTGITDPASVIQYATLFQDDYFDQPQLQKNIYRIFKSVRRALSVAKPLVPILPQSFYILHQEGYDVMYHPGTKCPIVREVLYAKALVRNVDNRAHQGYRQHRDIPQQNRATLEDFKTPGVICGHAKPRADAVTTALALYDVGYLTNIIAEDPILNNGLWKKLETEIRNWAHTHLCLHVYTGGVFTAEVDVKGPKTISHRVIGTNEVHMPTHLFKVIYVFDYGFGWRSLAYLIPNVPLAYEIDLAPYVVPVKRIQELSGVDFEGKYRL